MCLAFPGKIISIDENNQAVIDVEGTRRETSLDLMDEAVTIGEYIVCHAGFAIHKVDEELALEQIAMLRQLLEDEI
ncbi:MAG: HypC/HybG/HupF family hydrogenase formation chaperone [Deltaproteobacteria bacterium]|nr:HypC/HybG/HupF family hydrogenase formation chaperone [Candidatus Zymogenaceae bacterium]